jgi:CheY-like chemotaxis protein
MTLILIVDDAFITRKIISKTLNSNGYQTIEASSGSQALKMIRQQMPACILLDLLLPEPNGFEILEILQKENFQIPVIVITADTQATSKEKCLSLGAQTIIYKPPKPDALMAAIQQAIGLKEEENL